MTQGKGVGMGVSNEARSETGLVAQIQMLSGCPPTRGGCGWSTRTRRLNPHTFFPCLVSHHSKHSITASTRSPTAHWTRARTNVAGMRFWRSAQRVGGRTVRVEDLGSGLQSAPIPFFGGVGGGRRRILNRDILLGSSWRSGAVMVRGALGHHVCTLSHCVLVVVLGRNLQTALFATLPQTTDLCLPLYYTPPSVAMPFCIFPRPAVRPSPLWMH